MASRSPLHSVKLFVFLILLSASAFLKDAATATQFRVGGPLGWRKPTGFESETYNQWAGRNRFHVGDSLYFKYQKDSLLVVDKGHYDECNTMNPLSRFTDGNTTFRFDRFGYFYFISGQSGHCKAGQKLIVRVMVHPEMIPAPAPAPMSVPFVGSSPTSWSGSPDQPESSGSWRIGKTDYVLAIGLIGVLAWQMV
ncbi:Early nodulin-like protein 1 [Dendrobium catenatum]|uniref:Early nodulin-like protein 1 n=1 Tax=Dendrobium catenatum TaxID=906689 RepID=A0A2I0VSH8_9ASPA|nr:Early nodulin-like protein 1 [Dendrobium catenatum]